MGIDIGDLSTVILCSMPPAQSQFLQRVGRAGRKDEGKTASYKKAYVTLTEGSKAIEFFESLA